MLDQAVVRRRNRFYRPKQGEQEVSSNRIPNIRRRGSMTTDDTPEKSSDSPWHVFRIRLQPCPLRPSRGQSPFLSGVLPTSSRPEADPARIPSCLFSLHPSSPRPAFVNRRWSVPPRPDAAIRRSLAASNGVSSHVAFASEPLGRVVPAGTVHRVVEWLQAQRLRARYDASSKPVPVTTTLGPEQVDESVDGPTATAERPASREPRYRQQANRQPQRRSASP